MLSDYIQRTTVAKVVTKLEFLVCQVQSFSYTGRNFES